MFLNWSIEAQLLLLLNFTNIVMLILALASMRRH